MTANFVWAFYSGNKVPTLQEMFPDVFKEEIQQAKQDEQALMLYREQMIDFANYHNKKRHQMAGEIIDS